VVNVEDVDNAAVLVDLADDAVGAAPGTVTAGERPEQRRRRYTHVLDEAHRQTAEQMAALVR
jgi:hypothetical protein